MDEVTAGEQLFDFRIADIAMGSGHFLVFAIDRIERAFTNYLAQRKLPVVSKELARLRESANAELGEMAAQVEIEDAQLIRRLIAKRCVYGVDYNPTAVQLASE
jgi:type II restriction/modification system DNA methylase subunit YeeA